MDRGGRSGLPADGPVDRRADVADGSRVERLLALYDAREEGLATYTRTGRTARRVGYGAAALAVVTVATAAAGFAAGVLLLLIVLTVLLGVEVHLLDRRGASASKLRMLEHELRTLEDRREGDP